jgi:hypothetical protein
MSSAFLYLGIVLMWLCVLVPMWLRRDRHTVDIAELYDESEESDGDTLADLPVSEALGTPPGTEAADPSDDEITVELGATESRVRPHPTSNPVTSSTDARPSSTGPDASLASRRATSNAGAREEFSGEELSQAECRRRARVMARRRRWLLCSVLLHLASVVTAAVGVAPWWSVAPSAVLLVAYLTVLRVAVAVDAERRIAAAKARAEEERIERNRRRELEVAAQQAEAEIIEFRRRVEPFDQYADRSRRAVGH